MRYKALKADMKLCEGTRNGYSLLCNGTLFRCRACGKTGCQQTKDHLCTGQGFGMNGRCYGCGATGQLEQVV